MIDITGQVQAAVAAAMREQASPWRAQGNAAGYVPPQGYPPLPSPQQPQQVQQRTPPQQQQPRPAPQPQRVAPAQSSARPAAAVPTGRASPPRSESPFFGACFNCNGTGHRSSECPHGPQCYNCWQLGHLSREWPNPRIERPAHIPVPMQRARTPRPEVCQACDAPGYTVRTCPRCAPTLSAAMGNLHLGSQE